MRLFRWFILTPIVSSRFILLMSMLSAFVLPISLQLSAFAQFSDRFEVVQQSLQGVILRYDRQEHWNEETPDAVRGYLAVPQGDLPEVAILETTYSLKKGDEIIQEATGWIPAGTESFPPFAYSIQSIVSLEHLGFLREARLAVVELKPSHTFRHSVHGNCLAEIGSAVFRFDFAPGAQPASLESSFDRPFRSGFKAIFDSFVLNSEAMPFGCPIDETTRLPDLEKRPYLAAPSLRLSASSEGWYFLSAEELTRLDPILHSPMTYSLHHDGEPIDFIPLNWNGKNFEIVQNNDQPLSEDDGLVFFSPASESPFSPNSVFFLTLDDEDAGEDKSAKATIEASGQIGATTCVEESLLLEQNRLLWPKRQDVKDIGQHDYWVWAVVEKESPFSCRMTLPGPVCPSDATVELDIRFFAHDVAHYQAFQGYRLHVGDWKVPQESIEFSKSGRPRELTTASTAVPATAIHESDNIFRFTIEPVSDNETPVAAPFSLDSMTLRYNRQLVLGEDGMCFAPAAGQSSWAIQCDTNSATQAIALAHRQDNSLEILSVERKDGYLSIGTSGPSQAEIGQVLVFTPRTVFRRPHVSFSTPSGLSQEPRAADLIVITHPSLIEAATPLVEYRKSQGYRVELISTHDIYRDFGDGSLNPESIRDFIRYAYRNWVPPRPSYVLLIGEARWDYWGYLNAGVPNLIPSYREESKYPSDDWYVSVCSKDPIPDLMISRLSVETPQQLEALIEKIVSYDRNEYPGPWQGRAFLFSDNEEIFERKNEEHIAQDLPAYMEPLHLRLREFPFLDNYYAFEEKRVEKKMKYAVAARDAIAQQLSRGHLLWIYYGHGAPNVITEERAFFGGGSAYSDVKSMRNRPYLPIMLAMTCDTNQFDYAGEVGEQWTLCLGEELVNLPSGGAIAIYGSTGRGYTEHHAALNTGFLKALFDQGFRTLGEMIMMSKLETYAKFRLAEPLRMFGLLGDLLTTVRTVDREVPIHIEGEASQLEGGTLTVEVDLQEIDPRQLRGYSGRVWAQDAQGNSLAIEQPRRMKKRALKLEFPVPSGLPEGKGSVGLFVHPEASSEEWQSYFGGGTDFEIAFAEESAALPADGTPDLSIVPDSITFTPSSPRSGETIFIDVLIENRGQGAAEDVAVLAYAADPDKNGGVLPDRANWQQPSIERIQPGKLKEVRLRWDPFQVTGWNSVRVKVDPHDRIPETDEQNNSATAELYIREKMDLAVYREDILLSTSEEHAGYRLKVAVRNLGESPSAQCPLIIAPFDSPQSEMPIEDALIEIDPLPVLPARREKDGKEIATRVWLGPFTIPPQTESVEVYVDPQESVDENNHDNNRIRVSVEGLL